MDVGDLIPPTVEAEGRFLLSLPIACISVVEEGTACMRASSSGGGRRYRYPCRSANEIEGHLNRPVRPRPSYPMSSMSLLPDPTYSGPYNNSSPSRRPTSASPVNENHPLPLSFLFPAVLLSAERIFGRRVHQPCKHHPINAMRKTEVRRMNGRKVVAVRRVWEVELLLFAVDLVLGLKFVVVAFGMEVGEVEVETVDLVDAYGKYGDNRSGNNELVFGFVGVG